LYCWDESQVFNDVLFGDGPNRYLNAVGIRYRLSEVLLTSEYAKAVMTQSTVAMITKSNLRAINPLMYSKIV